MNTQGKVWGSTSSIFLKNNVEVNRIEAKKGGFCSKHKHSMKHNMFFVEFGTLEISVWKNDYKLVDKTILTTGQCMSVQPGEYHSFRAIVDTVAYEIYWTELAQNDIQRETVGGTAVADTLE